MRKNNNLRYLFVSLLLSLGILNTACQQASGAPILGDGAVIAWLDNLVYVNDTTTSWVWYPHLTINGVPATYYQLKWTFHIENVDSSPTTFRWNINSSCQVPLVLEYNTIHQRNYVVKPTTCTNVGYMSGGYLHINKDTAEITMELHQTISAGKQYVFTGVANPGL